MKKLPVIALAGNPNSGKTTIFNNLTGSSQRIGNWPGVTVEKKSGRIGGLGGEHPEVECIDLPGIYSFTAESEDEFVARDYLLDTPPDLLINIIDASQLERNLFLTTQLMEMGIPMVGVLNMMDIADSSGQQIDIEHLQKHLGIPLYPYTAVAEKAGEKMRSQIAEWLKELTAPSALVRFPNELEEAIARIAPELKTIGEELQVPERWVAIKALEEDSRVLTRIDQQFRTLLHREILAITDCLKDTPDVLIADHRYGCIRGVLKDAVQRPHPRESRTDKIDRVVMHPVFGIPVFLAAMFMVFWISINLGEAFIDFFEIITGAIFIDGLGRLMAQAGLPDFLIAVFADGIGTGIQTVSTFIPMIFLMFLMLSLLEDSGYMARAAFLMDRAMRALGLPGKAFVPMMVGFGCTVPAIMAARTLDTRKDRLMTVYLVPLMSCGARLPVFALFAGAFFSRFSGLIVFSLYLAGILVAVLSGLLFKQTLFRGEASHFIMELPRYHSPRFKHIMIHTLNRLQDFILRAGKVIIVAVFVLGLLGSLGRDGSFGNEANEKSVLAGIGKGITPVFVPMGVDSENWPAAVGLFTGIFAKEAIVGTLNGLYSQIELAGERFDDSEEDEDTFSLLAAFEEAFASIPAGIASAFWQANDEDESEAVSYRFLRTWFNPYSAYAYLLFVLIYLPCLAAWGAAVKEAGLFHAMVMAVYLSSLAWIVATLFYQLAAGRSLLWIFTALGGIGIWYGLLRLIGDREKRIARS